MSSVETATPVLDELRKTDIGPEFPPPEFELGGGEPSILPVPGLLALPPREDPPAPPSSPAGSDAPSSGPLAAFSSAGHGWGPNPKPGVARFAAVSTFLRRTKDPARTSRGEQPTWTPVSPALRGHASLRLTTTSTVLSTSYLRRTTGRPATPSMPRLVQTSSSSGSGLVQRPRPDSEGPVPAVLRRRPDEETPLPHQDKTGPPPAMGLGGATGSSRAEAISGLAYLRRSGRHRGPRSVRVPSGNFTADELQLLQEARSTLKPDGKAIVGVLIPEGGKPIFLQSGGGQGYTSHVEGKATTKMVELGITKARLLVELEPCQICDRSVYDGPDVPTSGVPSSSSGKSLPLQTSKINTALPPDTKLTVVGPKSTGTYEGVNFKIAKRVSKSAPTEAHADPTPTSSPAAAVAPQPQAPPSETPPSTPTELSPPEPAATPEATRPPLETPPSTPTELSPPNPQ